MRRCAVHPCKGCRAQTSTPALEAAADRTVILSWWQLRITSPTTAFGAGSNTALLRSFCAVLTAGRGSGCRASTRRCGCISKRSRRWRMRAAPLLIWRQSPSRALMADAAADLTDEKRRRILGQILYQLGRWIYLIDAADDLKKDTESGNYNPLLYRYHTENGVLGDADRLALAETLDASIERMASAYALYDYGVWTPILDSIFYESLYGIGKAVLDGTYRRRTRTRYGERKKKSNEEAL